MNKIDYVVYIHRLYDSGRPKLGGLDYLIEHLLANGKRVLVVESPLYPRQYSTIVVTYREGTDIQKLYDFDLRFSNDAFVWLVGILIDFYVAARYKTKNAYVLSSDPLSSFPAIVLRKAGLFRFHYYHCTDYSETRFKNKFLNQLYRWLLSLSMRNADLVGAVSKRILDQAREYNPKNITYIPNSPDFESYANYRVAVTDRNKKMLVLTCAGIIQRYNVLETIRILAEVLKSISGVKLTIIGSTDLDKDYYSKVLSEIVKLELQDSVIFTGYVSREANCEIIARSYIGIALYDPVDSYSKYADPLKIREYAALGIPCVSDLVTSASEEMAENKAGYAVSDYKDAVVKIVTLLQDNETYIKFSENALKWAMALDKQRILKKLIDTYLA
ncbi:glycosyltransferase [candidate division WWE3 bacterium]|uniref:Glycosyltransferase n=1 Tax=candidate division WWE3 bacterium TaxID=2053526 RepID=A0A7X9DJN3_UNCKA|nr:glycosyltransferase [candidate division WWE3 bacterium]